MSYYMSATLNLPFDQCLERVTGALQTVHNEALQPIAEEIRSRFKRMIKSLQNGKGRP